MKVPVLKLCIVFIFLVAAFCAYSFNLYEYLTLETIKLHKKYLQLLVQEHFSFIALSYILFYTLLVACALPAAGVLTIAGGAMFGTLSTTLFVCIGATSGAIISFLLARYVLRDFIEQKYGIYVARINNEMIRHGYNYMLVLRLLPIMPFFIINPLVGLTRLPLFTFIWTTVVGILPGVALFAAAGQRLMMIDSMHDILSWESVLLLFLLAGLAFVPSIIQYVSNYQKA